MELIAEVRDATLMLMCYTPITARIIASAQKLRGIVKYGVGIDAIDLLAAQAKQIPVVNVPEYAEETVAEGAFLMLLALARKLLPLHHTLKTQGWAWPTSQWLASDIAGKTVGLVGVGRIGRNLARMAGLGFRSRILGYDPHVSREDMQRAGVEKRENLREMLCESDFVSLHCVLNSETRHLIGHAELASMKRSAFLINVSRGALVDEAALVQALKDGVIAGAGLDVFSEEPLRHQNHPMSALFGMENVILMPHLTFFTREAMERLEDETLERCVEILENRPVLVKSRDPRLTSQKSGVIFDSEKPATGMC